jgi:ribosome-interacting GTPase 1
LDAARADVHRQLIEKEVEQVGIRLNKRPPNISFVRKHTGGFKFTSTVPLTQLSERLVYDICHAEKIFNAEVVVREDASVDDFLDVLHGNIKYMPCLYVYNKIDCITIEEVDRLAREPHSAVISCEWDLNLQELVEQIWEHLSVMRIYTKRRGEKPDLSEPMIMRRGSTVADVCRGIHRTMVDEFKYALVWGLSTKHDPQRVGLTHELADEDVIQIAT